MAQLPTGTMTFLFTGLDVSTRLWEREPDAMRDAPARHDAILREVVPKLDGHLVRGTGDGIHAVFATADAAVPAAIDGQREVVGEACGVSEPPRVSVGLHTGVAELRDGGHYGSEVNRAARLMPVAHGRRRCSMPQAGRSLSRSLDGGRRDAHDPGRAPARIACGARS